MSTRFKAAKAFLTGRLPERIVEKPIIVKEVQVVNLRRAAHKARRESTKGSLVSNRSWTDRIPHPPIMSRLDEINQDPDVDVAITIMTEMVASGYYTEMGDEVSKNLGGDGKEVLHPNKAKLDNWGQKAHADERFTMAVREMFEKGFFAIELDPADNSLKVLPSDTMYMWRDKTGKLLKYTQEYTVNDVVAKWEGDELKNIIWYAHKETPLNPYGKALAFCLEDFVDARKDMTRDGPAVLHRLGYPMRRWEAASKEVIDKVFANVTAKAPEEDLFLDGLQEGDLRVITDEVNAKVNIESFQTSNDRRISDGLFAPSISVLRNATEASATKILDAFHEHAQGIQLNLKRKFENDIFALITGDPVPRLAWGRPKTGVEKVTYADIGTLYNGGNGAITFDQAQDLLKKLGLPLKDLASGAQAPNTQVPNLTNLPALDPVRMQTIRSSLGVIEKNYRARNIDLADAFLEASRVIRVHIEALRKEMLAKIHEANREILELSPESERYFQVLALELSSRFREKLLPTGTHEHAAEGERAEGRKFIVTIPSA